MFRFFAPGLTIVALALAAPHPARAASLTWTGNTQTTATGTLADPSGLVGVTLSLSNHQSAVDGFFYPMNSSDFGTFFGGRTAADIYTPDPPGTNDFLLALAGSDAAVYTLTFSRPVTDVVFHIFNMDFRNYSFLGGATPTVVSGLNLVASGNTVRDTDFGATFDNGDFSDPNKGGPTGSAYGSFRLDGTFTSISWTRNTLVPGAFATDGNMLGVSASAVVPEPASLALAAVGGLMLAGARRRRSAR